MTTKEADRLRLLKNHADGMVTLTEISKLLGISYRQTKRIWHDFKIHGEIAVISKKRNNCNRSLDRLLQEKVLSLIKTHYSDFGPTLVTEKLEEDHKIKISKETIRKIMIKHGLRQVKKRKQVKVYQRRKRRSCFGELVQVDGSPHAWFEESGPYCTLLLAVDDATGQITAAKFEQGETTEGYFRLMDRYLQVHGKPICLYTDKHGAFRVNQGGNRSKPTQFARAMKELDIKMIAAHSPQAKGRIERANGVLQDRLVKELRCRGISTIEEANKFLPTYIESYNKRFGKAPSSPFNAHRELDHNHDLDQILCVKEERKLSKNLEVRHKNIVYQINAPNRINRLRGVGVQVVEKMNGEILIEYKGELLDFSLYEEFESQPKVVDHKELVLQWENSLRKSHKPKKDHSWRGSKSVNF